MDKTITIDGENIGGVMAARVGGLPASARSKIKILERAESKRTAQYNEIGDRQDKLRKRRDDLLMQVNHAESEIAGGWLDYGPADHARVDEWRAELAECRAEINALEEEKRTLPGGMRPDAVLDWLRAQPSGTRFRECVRVAKLRKGETASQALENLRRERVEFEEQKRLADRAPLPLAEARAALIAEVDRRAEKGRPSFLGLSRVSSSPNGRRRTGNVVWPKVYLGGINPQEIDDGANLAIWINADAIKARGLADLEANHNAEDALTLAERELRIAECDAAILELSRIEEGLVILCEKDGFSVARRSDAPVIAVLGIEVDDSPLPAATPETDESDDPEAIKTAVKRSRLRGPVVAAEAD